MPFSLNFSLVYSAPDNYSRITHPGVVMLSDRTLVCGHQQLNGAGLVMMEFLTSTDEGLTWSKRSELDGGTINGHCRMAHLPGKILCYPGNEINDNLAKIYRSTDGANTWTMVHDFNPNGFTNKFYAVSTITAYAKNSLVAFGSLAHAANDGFDSKIARSVNGGLTWTLDPITPAGTMNSTAFGISPGSNGNMLAELSQLGAYRSNDNCTSFLGAAAIPTPLGATNTFVFTSTWITPTVVIAAGGANFPSTPFAPFIARSIDAGVTWTLVPQANIQNWPTGSPQTSFNSLCRLTKNGALLGWTRNGSAATPPLRYSIDQGLNWLEPSFGGHSWIDENPQASGAMVTTPSGNIVVSLPTRRPGDWTHDIWLGEVTC